MKNGALGSTGYYLDIEQGTLQPGQMAYDWLVKNGGGNIQGAPRVHDGLRSFAIQQRDKSIFASSFFFPLSARGDTRQGPPTHLSVTLPAGMTTDGASLARLIDSMAVSFEAKFIQNGGLRLPPEGMDQACADIILSHRDTIQGMPLYPPTSGRLDTSMPAPHNFSNLRVLDFPAKGFNPATYKSELVTVAGEIFNEFMQAEPIKDSIVLFCPPDMRTAQANAIRISFPDNPCAAAFSDAGSAATPAAADARIAKLQGDVVAALTKLYRIANGTTPEAQAAAAAITAIMPSVRSRLGEAPPASKPTV
ncbi:MAG: hypothetical protein H6866_07680 [Rhodospirillales bacterium]|nr:MAG: hypothetical protein H6866_07680 [Rhodospirillales bacterium]